MRKQYSQLLALALMKRLRDGESLEILNKETGISIPTLWRWREGKTFPTSGISKNYSEYYEENRQDIIERIKRNKYGCQYFDVLKRDNYKCQNCGRTTYLHVHHKDGNKKNNNPDNLVTLCKSCHRITHLIHLCMNKVPPYGRLYELAKLIL